MLTLTHAHTHPLTHSRTFTQLTHTQHRHLHIHTHNKEGLVMWLSWQTGSHVWQPELTSMPRTYTKEEVVLQAVLRVARAVCHVCLQTLLTHK